MHENLSNTLVGAHGCIEDEDKSLSTVPRCQNRISMATPADRQRIYEMRHAVYATELGQHQANAGGMLTDSLDSFNEYIVAHFGSELVGFVSITPPGFASYSIDKYIARDELPLQFDDGLYEVRLLTVAEAHRGNRLAETLMYAAFRWVEDHNGKQIIAIGRTEVLSIYLKCGLRPLDHTLHCGSVQFELLEASVDELTRIAERRHDRYRKLQHEVIWDLAVPFFKPPCCFHGGAFFEAIGSGFEALERRHNVINADVLDAWFPPSPKVIEAIEDHLPWLMRTSPPTNADGMRDAIARFRGVPLENIMPGAGSSDLIYLAFRQWLTSRSRVLILDPTYGEYMHVLGNVIRCHVERLTLSGSNQYALDLDQLRAHILRGYDLVVLVNPNNPTGQHIPRVQLENILQDVRPETRVWIDEAYLEYVGPNQSMEQFAAQSESVLVCKSMSKVFALSGLRAAYLCGPKSQLSGLIPWVPPWAVSLVAQLASVRALEDPAYYAEKYAQTRLLRDRLVSDLQRLGIKEMVPSRGNFVMFHLEPHHPTAAALIKAARESGVFLRDVASMGASLGPRALRVAVKDRDSNQRVLDTLESILRGEIARSAGSTASPKR